MTHILHSIPNVKASRFDTGSEISPSGVAIRSDSSHLRREIAAKVRDASTDDIAMGTGNGAFGFAHQLNPKRQAWSATSFFCCCL